MIELTEFTKVHLFPALHFTNTIPCSQQQSYQQQILSIEAQMIGLCRGDIRYMLLSARIRSVRQRLFAEEATGLIVVR